MDSYRQGIGGQVWRYVSRTHEQFTDQRTRLFFPFQMRYQHAHERGFRAIGYHLDDAGQHLVERQ